MSVTFPLLIDGRWRAGARDRILAVINPATGDRIGDVALAERADLDEALAAAERGLAEWSAVSPWQRGALLKKAADLLRADAEDAARTMTLEQGKPLAEARAEVLRSADFLEWGGEEARRISGRMIQGREAAQSIQVETHPIGVVAAFTPWNFPMALAAKKFAGALGAGCSIICKPSEETPGSAIALARALLGAGVPQAAIAIVFGEPAEVSSYLIPARAVAKITFTGSIPVGKLLASAAGQVMKPVTMELGGHAPTIVCGDVDPEKAADFLARAKFANSGQICLSPTRFFVEESVRARFTARMVEHARAWRVGDGLDPQTQMGPLASERRVEAVSKLVEDARDRGAIVAAGGERLGNRGFFYAPTILTDVPDEAAILREEPFGPVAPILPFSDEEAMLAAANGLEFGLSAYVFTGDAARQKRLKDALQFGAIGINDVVSHPPDVPLGGWKESGYGTEGGIEILEPYQKVKFVSLR
ncbi:NAD-dependent succinate-semialdehyde dehydrogenase [Enterovirga rhinocerotis]|uniref:Succinate-semialdehyde dehydrogenase/glutarate-semialdehyde dehydrogenase n=1 Tax=Enterovirga rhinocerotis TaxID=1339210 RepID=A0A4R7BVE9_9HYPH|nr:NAD-dependent succinate-semialdehyde dehydrogenase [Enterovirga rhinocerotis]TDR88177.1 succinate-semialdehyde dehydrogenase/glutarate-semialdehyde dehydrogenase [Enterovirga rhinocerotis]